MSRDDRDEAKKLLEQIALSLHRIATAQERTAEQNERWIQWNVERHRRDEERGARSSRLLEELGDSLTAAARKKGT